MSHPPRTRTTLAVAALAALAAAGAPRAAAQQQPAGLTLDDAVRGALAANPQILLARARLDAGRGEVLSAGAAFDTRVSASLSGEQDSRFDVGQSGSLLADPTVSRSTAYAVGAARMLRSGITLAPTLSVTRTSIAGLPVSDAGSSVGMNVTVPLLRDRWGRASAAPERAARAGYDASAADLRHTTALGVLETAEDYWQYAAALARVEVYRGSEERARRLLEETQVLVRSDERPAADLDQLAAALASKHAARIAAEQGAAEARRSLGLAMGLAPAEIAALPAAATAFPAAEPWSPSADEEARLERLALSRRADLAQAALQRRSAEALQDGARSGLKPRLDLQVGAGYAGRQLGAAPAARQLLQPLFRDVAGLNASVRVQYQLPVANAQARGELLQRAALTEQQRVAERDLSAQVASGVSVAAQALSRSAAQLAEAERAAELFRVTVDHEREKNRLGASTLFDVSYAEDNLTNAQLGVVAGRLAYAAALAELRFATGTLDGDGAAALTARP